MSEFYLKVAGVTFEGRQRVIAGLKEGQALKFVPDPNNPYDSSAVKIVTEDGTVIGFIGKDRNAQIFGNLMNHRGEYRVSVSSVTGGGFGANYGCNIKVVYTEKSHIPAAQEYAEIEKERNELEQSIAELKRFVEEEERSMMNSNLSFIEQVEKELEKERIEYGFIQKNGEKGIAFELPLQSITMFSNCSVLVNVTEDDGICTVSMISENIHIQSSLGESIFDKFDHSYLRYLMQFFDERICNFGEEFSDDLSSAFFSFSYSPQYSDPIFEDEVEMTPLGKIWNAARMINDIATLGKSIYSGFGDRAFLYHHICADNKLLLKDDYERTYEYGGYLCNVMTKFANGYDVMKWLAEEMASDSKYMPNIRGIMSQCFGLSNNTLRGYQQNISLRYFSGIIGDVCVMTGSNGKEIYLYYHENLAIGLCP